MGSIFDFKGEAKVGAIPSRTGAITAIKEADEQEQSVKQILKMLHDYVYPFKLTFVQL
jgi:hypothetical protein